MVTAFALFFSTFSTPILSAAFTFGLCRSPDTSAPTCGTSSRSSQSPSRRRSHAALYWVLPNLAPFDVKAQVVHGRPVAAGYVALDASPTGFCISPCC